MGTVKSDLKAKEQGCEVGIVVEMVDTIKTKSIITAIISGRTVKANTEVVEITEADLTIVD